MKHIITMITHLKAKHLSVLCLLCLWPLTACHEEPNPDDLALQAAKGYYDELLAGNYEAFLNGKATADSMPQNYRSQMFWFIATTWRNKKKTTADSIK